MRHRAGREHQQRAAALEPGQRLAQRGVVLARRRATGERIDVDHQRIEFRYPPQQVIGQDAQVRSPLTQRLRQGHALDPAEGMVRHHHQWTAAGHLRQALRVQLAAHAQRSQRIAKKIAVRRALPGTLIQAIQARQTSQAIGGGQ